MTPVICMITDRQRRVDAGGGSDSADGLVRRVAAAARAGVHLIHVRERDLDARTLVRLVTACLEAVRHTPARIVVNDRTDVARAAGAHGVHLRADSMPAWRVRAITGPGFLIGRSIHSVGEALQADADGAVDYLVFGPVCPTTSKPGATAAGPDLLAGVVRATTIPVLAVGGVTPRTAPAVARAGAAGAAAIGLFADPADERGVYDAVAGLRDAFDSAHHGS